MAVKNTKLTEAIYKHYRSISACAKAMGWSRQRMNAVLHYNGRVVTDDLPKFAKVIGISVDKLVKLLQKD